jgi:integrase
MIRRVGLTSENGRPYGLHSLRHFVATQLYNKSKDWIQVAKFMGHRDPGITMKLYANHVIEAGQRELGALAAEPWWAGIDG